MEYSLVVVSKATLYYFIERDCPRCRTIERVKNDPNGSTKKYVHLWVHNQKKFLTFIATPSPNTTTKNSHYTFQVFDQSSYK